MMRSGREVEKKSEWREKKEHYLSLRSGERCFPSSHPHHREAGCMRSFPKMKMKDNVTMITRTESSVARKEKGRREEGEKMGRERSVLFPSSSGDKMLEKKKKKKKRISLPDRNFRHRIVSSDPFCLFVLLQTFFSFKILVDPSLT